jgi:hypothetical protein
MHSPRIVACATSALPTSANLNLSLTREPRLYLAGPIRGIPDFAERFAFASRCLRADGYAVFNPVEQDEAFERHGMPITIDLCLEYDLAWVCRWADVVGLLTGWHHSSGALAEYFTARARGIPAMEVPLEFQLS